MKGLCILIPAKHNYNYLHKTDTILKWLDPMLSIEFEACTTFEQKLAVLFTVKEKWTAGELELYLKSTLEPEQNLQVLLQRNSRTVKEQNPFDAKKTTLFYIKKF